MLIFLEMNHAAHFRIEMLTFWKKMPLVLEKNAAEIEKRLCHGFRKRVLIEEGFMPRISNATD
jgi:hypothetical protein